MNVTPALSALKSHLATGENRMKTARLACAACAAAFLLAPAAAAQTETYTYAEINGMPIELDFRRPQAEAPVPLIIWIHGGGWRGGERNFPQILQQFLDDGYALATIDYRLTGQSAMWNGASVSWPAQAHDGKAAVRWLRAHAEELNVDPCAFIAWGSSAGGHLAAVLGTTNGDQFLEGSLGAHIAVSSDIQLAVDYFGPADLLFMNPDVTDPPGSNIDHDAFNSPESFLLGSETTGVSIGDIRGHLGDPAEPWPQLTFLARSASPARTATNAPGNVPMFIAHGQQDTSVPHAQSIRLRDALAAVGTPVAFRSVPDAGHGMPPEIAVEVKAWLDEQVLNLADCACPADFTNDGLLNFFDVQRFLNLFAAQAPRADFNHDGDFNFFDVLAFLQAFDAGCS